MAGTKTVVVVGGGLAGLMAAMKLAEAGHKVKLFSLVPVSRRSGSGTRTRDTAIMSRLLYRLSYPAPFGVPNGHDGRFVPSTPNAEPPCGIEPQTFSLPWRRSAD